MSEGQIERRLAAILAADVVGYSRLMGRDEAGTLARLRSHRRELIDPKIVEHKGRIVKTTGDGILVEFPSVVEAVACAVAVQRGMTARETSCSEDWRIRFRVGVNLGDIIVEDGDIFGDGVNIAARLEALAEPGGICVSRTVRDQVRDKLPITFDDLGEQQVKNIARPVRAFGLTSEAIHALPELAPSGRTRGVGRDRRWKVGILIALAIGVAGTVSWVAGIPQSVVRPSEHAAKDESIVGASRASIVVLPLEVLSAESGSNYFGDGLTEDIISALGRFRELSVMSPGAAFAYRGKHPTPAEVGRDLKVRYVVEGSIRRNPDRIRVALTLTDTKRSAVLWTNKYDFEPKDIFAVQDRVTREISGALAVRVTSLELARSATRPANNLEAYDLVLRGRDLQSRLTRPANAQARSLFERAIELDDNYAPAYVGLGLVHLASVLQGWTEFANEAMERAENLAKKAIALDDSSSKAHALLGDVAAHFGDYTRALEELQRAIDLNGSDAEAYSHLIPVLLYSGDISGAIAAGELFERFQPDVPDGTAFYFGMACILGDRGPDAVRILRRVVDRNPKYLYAGVMLAVAYATVGDQAEAERQASTVRGHFPTFPRDQFGSALRDPTLRTKLDTALKSAGF